MRHSRIEREYSNVADGYGNFLSFRVEIDLAEDIGLGIAAAFVSTNQAEWLTEEVTSDRVLWDNTVGCLLADYGYRVVERMFHDDGTVSGIRVKMIRDTNVTTMVERLIR